MTMDIAKIFQDVGAEVPTDQNRIDPKVMQAIMSMAMVGQITKLRKNAEDNTSSGWMQGFTFNLTDTQIPAGGFKLEKDRLAQSIYVHNDGPSNVYLGLNQNDNPSVLGPGETLLLDFGGHKLELIYLRCDTGLTSVVRATVKG